MSQLKMTDYVSAKKKTAGERLYVSLVVCHSGRFYV